MINYSAYAAIPPTDHRAGEWEMEIPHATVSQGERFPLQWAAMTLMQVQTSFPWITPSMIEISGLEGQHEPSVWQAQRGHLASWLDDLATQHTSCTGLQMSADLTIHWPTTDGASAPTTITAGADLLCSLTVQGVLSAVLTIWPNVFTDAIRVYTSVPPEPVQYQIVSLGQVAAVNRALLQQSLGHWEQLTRGTITIWSSDLVAYGTERYGFAADAEPY